MLKCTTQHTPTHNEKGTEKDGARRKLVTQYTCSKLVGALTQIYMYGRTYVCMDILTYICTYRQAATKWFVDRLHSYCSAQQFSSTAHSVGHVEGVPTNKAAVGHTLHRTCCQCFFFLASFAFKPVLVIDE